MGNQDHSDWTMMGFIAIITSIAFMLKAISGGAVLTPRTILMQLLAKALWTGIVAAGIWSAITEFRELAPATAVAISAGVTILGADFIETLFASQVRKKLNEDDPSHDDRHSDSTPEPPLQAPEPPVGGDKDGSDGSSNDDIQQLG